MKTWQQVGAAGFASSISSTPLVLDSGGKPYVAYKDGAHDGKISVMRFNGTVWEQVGAAGFSTDRVVARQLALDGGDRPHLAFFESSNNQPFISVMRFNGTGWEKVRAFSAPGVVEAASVHLAVDSGGRPHVAYDYSDPHGNLSNDEIYVMRFNGPDWEKLGTIRAGATWLKISFALDRRSRPHVAYSRMSSTFGVVRFNGTNWTYLGGPPPRSIGDGVYGIRIALDGSSRPYVAAYYNDNRSRVMRFNGTDWEQVGATDLPGVSDFALDGGDTPYVAYKDEANGGKASVMRFNGTVWEQVGEAGFSAGKAEQISLALDGGGTPYVAYLDEANGGKISVMKFASPVK